VLKPLTLDNRNYCWLTLAYWAEPQNCVYTRPLGPGQPSERGQTLPDDFSMRTQTMSIPDIHQVGVSNRFPTLRRRLNHAALLKTVRIFVLAVTAIVIVSCGTSSRSIGSNTGIAVIGVVAKTGLAGTFDQNKFADDFAVTLSEQGAIPVLKSTSLRQIIGDQRHDDILQRYADRGRLAQQDIQLLMAAGLPTRHAMIVRVVEDYQTRLPAHREPVLSSSGAVLVDRERRVLATQRITRVSALLINLQNGDIRWDKSFSVDPVKTAYSTRYLGSSFTGSLVAAFANVMVNGVRREGYPAAPAMGPSLESLLDEVAKSQPVR